MRTTAPLAPRSAARLPRLLATGMLLAVTSFGAPVVVAESDSPTPQITTRQQDDRQLREYRVNGHLYAIEILPSQGASFFLLDSDGNGNFIKSGVTRASQLKVPSWALEK